MKPPHTADKIDFMKTLVNTTISYIEKDGCYLMIHRTKKDHDYNHDKWIGIGGKFENEESPHDCAVREVEEETGLVLEPGKLDYCGIVTFVALAQEGESYTEFMHVFKTTRFSGELKKDCDEGELEWVPINKMYDLPHWKGDEIFLDFIKEGHPFFALKLIYKDNVLLETWLDGKPYNHFSV